MKRRITPKFILLVLVAMVAGMMLAGAATQFFGTQSPVNPTVIGPTLPPTTTPPTTDPPTTAPKKSNQTITFPSPGDQTVLDQAGLIAWASSGLPIRFTVLDGPAIITGETNLTFSATGLVSVAASQDGDGTWNPAPSVINTFTVSKATAQVTLDSLDQTFTGKRRWVSATTSPTGLAVIITYDGMVSAPSNAGSYVVTGQVNDAIYEGAATGTLAIGKGGQTIAFASPGKQLRTARVVLDGQASSGLPVKFVVTSGPGMITSSSVLSFTGIGDVRIAARQPGNANWNAAPKVIVTVAVVKPVVNDYDGNGMSDLAVYESVNGGWTIGFTGGGTTNINWGFANSTVVCGDYNGDGKADLGVFGNVTGHWFIRTMNAVTLAWNYGPGLPQKCITVSGDYDGDGKDDMAVYNAATGMWYIWSLAKNSAIAWNLAWGWPVSKPVSGDYDGDGVSDLAVLDINIGHWYIYSIAKQDVVAWNVAWGWAGCAYLSGDYDGDRESDLAVYDQQTQLWHIYSLATGQAIALNVRFGFKGGIPVSGDYDGDGKTDLAVYNPTTGTWYIRNLAGTILMWNKKSGGGAAVPAKP